MARKSRRGSNVVSWIVLILGALLLLYPIASTLSAQYRQIQQNEESAGAVQELSDDTKARELARAREYNDRLLAAGPHARAPRDEDPGFDDYMSQLTLPESYHVMARVRIPRINVDLPVYHTTRPDVLYDGAGHMYGSNLPVGGDGTNAVISAHTGRVNAAMFDQLPMLKPGDDIFIDVLGERLRYRMTSREVVKPDARQRQDHADHLHPLRAEHRSPARPRRASSPGSHDARAHRGCLCVVLVDDRGAAAYFAGAPADSVEALAGPAEESTRTKPDR